MPRRGGFGSEAVDTENEKATSAPAPSSFEPQTSNMRYDPKNPVQIVGMGQNIDSKQWANLTSDERRRLQQDR
jgi:filamentous hemagglutinin